MMTSSAAGAMASATGAASTAYNFVRLNFKFLILLNFNF